MRRLTGTVRSGRRSWRIGTHIRLWLRRVKLGSELIVSWRTRPSAPLKAWPDMSLGSFFRKLSALYQRLLQLLRRLSLLPLL